MKKRLAKLTSDVINPFLVSFIVIILLSFESTSSTADALKWASIAVALSVLPVFVAVIYLVRNKKLEGIFVNPRRQRYKIYFLATTFGIISCVILVFLGAPKLLATTFIAGLAAIVVFMGVNFIWKISLHTAFIASSVTILIIVYSYIGVLSVVLFPPVVWARIVLKHHSPAQVAIGAVLSALIVVAVFQIFGILGTQVL